MARPENLKPLTTLRIFAAAWVVLYHYCPSLMAGARPGAVEKGYLGVELFFVLSGFILSHVYLQSFGETRFSYGSFLWARLARIYPVHIAVLAGLALLIAAASAAGFQAGDEVVVWSSLPAHLLLLQAWGLGQGGGWNHPSCSISAEWFAYLAFPAFAMVFWPLRSRPWVATALASLVVVVLNLVFPLFAGHPLTEATTAWGALRIVPCFGLGCAVYLLWRNRLVTSPVAAKALSAAVLAAIAVGAAFEIPDLVMVLLFGGLILALASIASTGSNLMGSKLGVYLGAVSFAVYMVCIPWELAFSKVARAALNLPEGLLPWPVWSVMFVGVIPAAMVVHHLVERPARNAMRAWEGAGFRLGRQRQVVI
ncbi:acyltransferase [soil metagenome]